MVNCVQWREEGSAWRPGEPLLTLPAPARSERWAGEVPWEHVSRFVTDRG